MKNLFRIETTALHQFSTYYVVAKNYKEAQEMVTTDMGEKHKIISMILLTDTNNLHNKTVLLGAY